MSLRDGGAEVFWRGLETAGCVARLHPTGGSEDGVRDYRCAGVEEMLIS